MHGLNNEIERSSPPGAADAALSPDPSWLPAGRCPCGTRLFHAAPRCPFTVTPDVLRKIAVPPGLTLVAGGDGSVHRRLEFSAPPPIALMASDPGAVLEMLGYAGISPAVPGSPAESVALHAFFAGRALGRDGPYDAVTFDWDHTFSNTQIFEGLLPVAWARCRKSPPPPGTGDAAVVAIETWRPFVPELAFGMMAGFAARQGLARLSDWTRYRPRVGIATHTWPDRLGLTAQYTPILPLMEGLLPGSPGLYAHFTSSRVRSVVHLHHFIDYTLSLIRRFDATGFAGFAPDQADELLRCLADGAAHRRKPIGAWRDRGWDTARMLHIDDSPRLIADLTRQAALAGCDGARFLYAPHAHSRVFRHVKAWHMLALPSLWRRRPQAMRGVIANIMSMEWSRSAIPDLLRRLGYPLDEDQVAWPPASLPAGAVMAVHPTPTTVATFWDQYVAPAVLAQALVRDVRRRHGGMRAIQRAWRIAALDQSKQGAPATRQEEVI